MIALLLNRISAALDLPVDQITAALCLLLAFPFAFLLHSAIFSLKPNHRLINYLAILPTYLFLYICFYVARTGNDEEKLVLFLWDMVSVHLPVLAVYYGLKHFAFLRKNPTLIFACLLAQLSYHHLSRQLQFYNQYTVNITGPLMMLVIKLSAFAYNVHDKKINLESVEIERFMAWCFMFAGFFTGPVIMYSDFEDFINHPLKMNGDNTSDTAKLLRGRKRRATFLILSASVLLVLGLLLQLHFPTHNLLSTVTSNTHSILHKFVFMHLSLLSWRIKYYVAWSLAEGALVIIGLGFIRKDNKIKWDRYQNVNFFAIESSCDFRTIIAEWNVSTNRWLHTYIYQRLGKSFKANLSTYLVSAFWHGFYPGYYITFLSGALYTALTRLLYKSVKWPLSHKYRQPLLYIPNYLLVDYFAAPFALQTFSDSWKFCRAWHFYGHIVLALSFILVKVLSLSSSKSKPVVSNKKQY